MQAPAQPGSHMAGGRGGTMVGGMGASARRYTDERIARGEIREATARQERIVLRGFAASYGRRPVEQLARVHVEAWMATVGPLAPATRRTYFGIVRRFCRWLVDHRAVRRDPTAGIKPPKPPRTLPRALTSADVLAVRHTAVDPRARCIIALLHDLGLRIGEVARLELGDIDWTARTVRIHGKGGHERLLPLTLPTIHAIVAYTTAVPTRGSTGPLIRNENDHTSPLTPVHLSRIVSDLMTAAGVKARPWDGRSAHAFRHTAAGELVDVEPDVRVVQAFLGHQHLSTTSVYLRRLDTGQLRAALERRAGTA